MISGTDMMALPAMEAARMRAIVVDDEPIMLNSFLRLSSGISDLEVVGTFPGFGKHSLCSF